MERLAMASDVELEGFKPYYKWITFNTLLKDVTKFQNEGFKPYYKWITFNTYLRNLISS